VTPARKKLSVYLFAVLAPLAATPVAYLVESMMPKGNISLVYLTAVLLVAAKTHTRPALVCAITSFFTYNFFFTQPEYSLAMSHGEEILTVSFFLLMAAVTGKLTANLREKLNVLNEREAINELQSRFSVRLARALDTDEVMKFLYEAVVEATSEDTVIVRRGRDGTRLQQGTAELSPADVAAIDAAIAGEQPGGRHMQDSSPTDYYFYPLSMKTGDPVCIGMKFKSDAISVEERINLSKNLIHQALLALARVELAEALESERVEKEQELLRSALLSSVSHDLKSPLSAMIGATTSLIELDSSLSESQKRELLESILEESQRLDSYIQNLLDMTRLGHGDLSLNRDWVSLDDVLNVVLKRVRSLHPGCDIRIATGHDLPLLSVHAALIEQALFNILDNAMKYSPEHSHIDLRAGSSDDRKGIYIYISDQGPGIPDDEKDKIFDMFHTIRDGDRHSTGTGLGLTISRGIINAHGGEITVIDDESNQGSTFKIYLPVTGTFSSD
jgi:two-component system sensor histidine kinase KdpD